MELRDYADRGVMLSSLGLAERDRLLWNLEKNLPEGCSEPVIGFDSILLVGANREAVNAWLHRCSKSDNGKTLTKSRHHTFQVDYSGPDLPTVAEACGLTVDAVIQKHCAPTYTVRMMGFSPGFPYLDGLDPDLHLDRRQSPRNHIQPGTVAIGGTHAGIYSVGSPGGWHLLGRIDATLFDLEAAHEPKPDPAKVFALQVGDRVKFEPLSAS